MDDELHAIITTNIKRHGQHLMYVGTPDDAADFQQFVYTIGNHASGLPELLVIGSSDRLYGRILNIIGALQRHHGKAFQHGELVDFTAKLPAKIIEADRRGQDEYAIQAWIYYGFIPLTVHQVLLPDQNGLYPDQPGCLAPYCEQPVLAAVH